MMNGFKNIIFKLLPVKAIFGSNVAFLLFHINYFYVISNTSPQFGDQPWLSGEASLRQIRGLHGQSQRWHRIHVHCTSTTV